MWSLLKWGRQSKLKIIPAEDQSEYHIGSTHADEHIFEAVVVRPMHQGVIDQLNVLKVNFGINVYDLVSVEGGALRIAKYGVEDISIDAVKIAYELHHVKKVVLIGLSCAPNFGIAHSFCREYPNEDSVALLLAKSEEILTEHLSELRMEMEISSYLLSLTEDGKKLKFFRVSPNKDSFHKSLAYSLPYRGRKEGDSVVVWCMDARFREATKTYLRAVLGLDYYGLVSIPGGAKGIVDTGDESAAMDCISSSVNFHGARNVHLINHMDCGAYGGSTAFCGIEDEIERLTMDLEVAAKFIVSKFPHVRVHTHMQRAEGEKVFFRMLKTFST